jgi:RNA polymerase sigma-70 factor (ECF subfamily)
VRLSALRAAAVRLPLVHRDDGARVEESAWDTPSWHDAAMADVGDAREVGGEGAAEHHARRLTARGSAIDDAALVELIARIELRDANALQALYEVTSARVYGFVHRFMRRHAWTEEVVEDTFWQVWRQAPRFDLRRGRAMTWLFAMARSRAIDALRREQRFQSECSLWFDGESGSYEPIDERADDLLQLTRGTGHLQEAVAALEPRARQLIALAFFRGMTHEEIASHTGMPLGSVKSAIRRALRQLRERLAPTAAFAALTATP